MAEPACRLCGCTHTNACYDEERGACSWATPDLCSHCKGSLEYLARRLEGTIPFAVALDVPHIAIATHHAEQFARILEHLGGQR